MPAGQIVSLVALWDPWVELWLIEFRICFPSPGKTFQWL